MTFKHPDDDTGRHGAQCGRARRPAPQVSTVAAAALAAQIERSLYDPFPGVDLTKPLTPLFERLSRP